MCSYLCVSYMRHYRYVTGDRCKAVPQQWRQWMIPVRWMLLSAQYRQQHISNARQWKTSVTIRTATEID